MSRGPGPALRLTTLGSGSAFSAVGHNVAACVDGRLLLDCGAPVLRLMPVAGLDPFAVDTVLISHFHADHSFQVALLLAARGLTEPASPPITVVGPPGTGRFIERLVGIGFGERLASLVLAPGRVRTLEWAGGEGAELGGYRVDAVALEHAPDLVALGYRVERDGVSLGYSGDTAWCDGILELARRSDYLLCECTSMGAPAPTHLCRDEVLRLMTLVPTTRVILTHLTERRPVPGALLAADGLTVPLRAPSPSPPRPRQPASGSLQAADADGQ